MRILKQSEALASWKLRIKKKVGVMLSFVKGFCHPGFLYLGEQ